MSSRRSAFAPDARDDKTVSGATGIAASHVLMDEIEAEEK
jgi:hypothetical protein